MKLDRGWAVLSGVVALLAIALFAGLVVLADGIRDRDVVDDTITVTGSAKRQITSDFEEITGVVEASSQLLAEGIPIAAEQPQYVFTKLPALRPQLLAAATKDAKQRAAVLVDATGGELGALRTVSVGVFQITAPNSTEVSDYGVYDTTTIVKDVTAFVNVTFALD